MNLLTAQPVAKEMGYIVARPTTAFLLIGGIILFVAIYASYLIANYCAKRWNGSETKARVICMTIMGLTTFAALLVYGTSIYTLQAVVLCGVCLYGSYSDFKTHTLDDCASCLVLTAGLIGHNTSDLPIMIVSGVLIGGIMLIVAIVSKGGGIGGADIKFSAATAFLLSLQRSLIGVIVGLLISVIVNGIRNKKKGSNETFPLIPYLSIGFMAAYFIK